VGGFPATQDRCRLACRQLQGGDSGSAETRAPLRPRICLAVRRDLPHRERVARSTVSTFGLALGAPRLPSDPCRSSRCLGWTTRHNGACRSSIGDRSGAKLPYRERLRHARGIRPTRVAVGLAGSTATPGVAQHRHLDHWGHGTPMMLEVSHRPGIALAAPHETGLARPRASRVGPDQRGGSGVAR